MTTPKDTDLREALRRKYADAPQLPSDFMDRLHHAYGTKKASQPLRRYLYPIAAVAACACTLLLLIPSIGQHQESLEPIVAEGITASLSKASEHMEDDVGKQGVPQVLASHAPRGDEPRPEGRRATPRSVTPQPTKEHLAQVAVPLTERQEEPAADKADAQEDPSECLAKEPVRIPPDKQASANILLAEEALQVAYLLRTMQENIRTSSVSLTDEETPTYIIAL